MDRLYSLHAVGTLLIPLSITTVESIQDGWMMRLLTVGGDEEMGRKDVLGKRTVPYLCMQV